MSKKKIVEKPKKKKLPKVIKPTLDLTEIIKSSIQIPLI